MSAETVLIIGPGWEQEPLVHEVKALGYRVFGIHAANDIDPALPIDESAIIPPRELDRILRLAEKLRPVAVVSDQCDYSYFATALIAEKLGLPGPRLAQAQLATNKLWQRRATEAAGVLQPAYRACISLDQAVRAAAEIGYPVVVKPVDNRGSFGVNRADDTDSLAEAYYDALINAHSRLVLVEGFVAGRHITVDGYCFPKSKHKSLALATKGMIGGKRQVAVDIIYPGELPEEQYQQALATNDAVVEKLGFLFGMTHAEYMIDDLGGIYLIEIANRGGGVFTSAKIVPAASGLDVTKQLVADSLGLERDLYAEKGGHERRGAYLKFFVFEPGQIQRLDGIAEAAALPGVEALRIQLAEGDEIKATSTDADRHGFVITAGKDREAARQAARRALETVRVVYA